MRLFLVILLCLIAAGCKSKPRRNRETALLRAELLDLEDKYYALKSKYNGVMSQLGEGEPYYDGNVIYEGEIISDGDIIYEGDGFYQEMDYVQPESKGPQIAPKRSNESLPSPGQNQPRSPEPMPAPDSGQTDVILTPPDATDSSEIEVSYPRVIPDAVQIKEISINRGTTRGRDLDGITGDEGIDLLVQPKSANGQTQHQAGELTVSLIDPAEPAKRQRIGLWKFLPKETRLFFANDELGNRGILLHLPWDQSTPVHEKLDLHVRFVTSDGQVFKSSTKIQIKPPAAGYSPTDPLVVGWTREDPRWIPETDPRMRAGDGSQWQRLTTKSGNASSGARTQPDDGRNGPQVPTKAEIRKPGWRPVR